MHSPFINTESRFEHDCTNCVYLGQLDIYDLYVCPRADKSISTVIARYGNDEYEYISGIEFASSLVPISEALSRAKSCGYYRRENN